MLPGRYPQRCDHEVHFFAGGEVSSDDLLSEGINDEGKIGEIDDPRAVQSSRGGVPIQQVTTTPPIPAIL